MNKFILAFLTTSLFFNSGYSQKKQEVVEKHSKIYIGLGGVLTSFQDIKYSNVRYSGIGTRLDIGIEKRKKNIWGLDLALIYSNEKAKTYSHGESSVLNGVLTAKYLLPLVKNKTHEIHLGGKWDVLDFYFRNIEDLSNNSTYYINGSNLKVSALYEREISNSLKLDIVFDFQPLSFMKESTSFGFSAPQDPLEDGEFGYQNEPLESPFGFKYFSFEAPWDYLNIGTQVKLHYKNRWTFVYNWNMQRSNKVKDYPLTKGYSSLSVIYNIKNK